MAGEWAVAENVRASHLNTNKEDEEADGTIPSLWGVGAATSTREGRILCFSGNQRTIAEGPFCCFSKTFRSGLKQRVGVAGSETRVERRGCRRRRTENRVERWRSGPDK